MKEKRWKSFSPGCNSISSKCTERASILTGVPVFMRRLSIPNSLRAAVRNVDAGSAQRPPGTIFLPMCINPLRNVPAVMTTAPARNSAPQMVLRPAMRPLSTMSSLTSSCQTSKLSVFSMWCLHSAINRMRSHCARGLHMAGPLERLSMRNWMAVASVTSPICPPSASISRTICPFAIPPTAGLQLICAILFMSMVMRTVRAPIRAAAEAASHPACPAPTTMTS